MTSELAVFTVLCIVVVYYEIKMHREQQRRDKREEALISAALAKENSLASAMFASASATTKRHPVDQLQDFERSRREPSPIAGL